MHPIAKKILRDIVREKTFLLALFLQILLILSLSILLNYTTLFFNPEIALQKTPVFGYTHESRLITFLMRDDKVILQPFSSFEEGITAYDNGSLDVLLHEVPQLNRTLLEIYLPPNQVISVMYLSLLKRPLDLYDSWLRNTKHQTTYAIPLEDVQVKKPFMKGTDVLFEILFGFLIPFIFLVPIFLVGTLLIDIVTEDLETKRLQLLLTATSLKNYLFGVLLVAVIILFFQESFWTILLLARGIHFYNLFSLFFYFFLFGFVIFMAALLLAFLYKNKSQAQLVFALVVIFFTALTNVVLLAPVNSIVALLLDLEPLPGYVYWFWIHVLLLEMLAFVWLQKKRGLV